VLTFMLTFRDTPRLRYLCIFMIVYSFSDLFPTGKSPSHSRFRLVETIPRKLTRS
jgi:hypothetical protein